jgi:hypothetical protein
MVVAPLDGGGSRGCHPPTKDLGHHCPLMGFGGLCRWTQQALSMGLDFFLFFYFINRGGHPNRLGKGLIYRDLSSEAFWMPASVNPKCPPPLKLYVVVHRALLNQTILVCFC